MRLAIVLAMGLLMAPSVTAQRKLPARDSDAAIMRCLVRNDQVTLWDEPNYSGHCTSFSIGSFPKIGPKPSEANPRSSAIIDDTVSSFRLGKDVKALVCQETDFRGRCEIIEGDSPSLTGLRVIKDNQISSMKVVSRATPNAQLLPAPAPSTAAADNGCSRNLDGQRVNLEVANATGKPFTVNLVDEKCREIPSTAKIAPNQVFKQTAVNGTVYRVRAMETNEILQRVVASPSSPLTVVYGAVSAAAPPAAAPEPAVPAARMPLRAGQKLVVGEKYASPDGRFYVMFPQDGNLMVHRSKGPGDTYQRGFYNLQGQNGPWKKAKNAMLAPDGNLILTDEKGTQIWSTNVPNPDPRMQLTFSDTGDLQLRRPSGDVAWSMNGDNNSPSLRTARVLPNGPPPMTAEEKAILDKHNQLRALHGAPPLKWSPVLAAEAQQWANTCGPMGHSRNTNGAGENLSAFQDPTNMLVRVQAWYDEMKAYNYNNPGFNKGGSSQATQTGHFTQLVWVATTEIGCAKALCPRSPYPGWLVCRYSPAGNYNDPGASSETSAFIRNVPRLVK